MTASANQIKYVDPSDISTSQIAALVIAAAGDKHASAGSGSASYAWG